MQIIQHHVIQLLISIDNGHTLNEGLAKLRTTELTASQMGAIQDITYGLMRRPSNIAFFMRQLLKSPLKQGDLTHLLNVALYQLNYTRAKPYAVVDAAVSMAAKLYKGQFKALVNGVLRQFLRVREDLNTALLQQMKSGEAAYNHPKWWVNRMRDAYPKSWSYILEANQGHPPMSLRINLRKTSLEGYLNLLQESGFQAERVEAYPSGLVLETPVHVQQLPYFSEGWVSVQDLGAQLAAPTLNVKTGMRVLDACAAPGGKSGHLLEIADIQLTALDIDEQRLKRVADNLQRLNLTAELVCTSVAAYTKNYCGQPFERILADVPCSATGVVRRHPDIKWLRRPSDFELLAKQQRMMLDQLWPLLAQNGQLLYATCSVMKEENEALIALFLTENSNARLLSEINLIPKKLNDGFYYALLTKV
ncbi:MAG: 16S rRNA (cytosine(967)-C(5))-methyltransferase RsmB [Neisseriaceae bacterium]|nr:16S rRNA (cytosine(967)-C(5))-methyltransferase RsmB [Neisseriaceae bacterium]